MPMTNEQIQRLLKVREMTPVHEIQNIIYMALSEKTGYLPIPHKTLGPYSFGVRVFGLLPSEAELDELTEEEMRAEKETLEMELGYYELVYHELRNTQDAADFKRVDRRTIRRWRDRGLDSFQFGKERYSKTSDLMDWEPGW